MNRKQLLWTLAVALLAAAVAAAVKGCPHVLPDRMGGELVARYGSCENVKAAFLKGKRLNDSLRVDVTVLRATDSAGWARLTRDFNAHGPTTGQRESLRKGKDMISFKLFRKDNSPAPIDTAAVNNVVAISYLKHAVCVYHTQSREQSDQILHCQIRYSISQYKETHK